MTRVAVTGASGMLGRAVAAALIARGDDVTVLQRRPSGLPCREVRADLADGEALARALRGADAVVHLAAKVGVTGSPRDFRRVNVEGTRAVLDAARRAGAGRFLHMSSPSVAHAGHALVGAGATPADPRTARGAYAVSKAVAERLALAADEPSFAVLALRPHLVWGPGDPQLVERIVARSRQGRLPLIGSGAALIDTTYVDNAVSATVAGLEAMARPDQPVHGRPLVVSNGEPRPVAELLSRICAAAGVRGPRGRVPVPLAVAGGAVAELVWAALRRTDDPPMTRFLAGQLSTAHWFDQRGTRSALRWAPTVPLEEGLRRLRGAR